MAKTDGTRDLDEAKLLRLGAVGLIRHKECPFDALERAPD